MQNVNWNSFKDKVFTQKVLLEAKKEALAIKDLLDENTKTILDVPCGVGRHLVELEKLGFVLTGVDITPEFSTEKIITGDMRNIKKLVKGKMFDAILNMYSSFGYFSKRENTKILKDFFDLLKPGGTFIIDTICKDTVNNIDSDSTIEHKVIDNVIYSRWLNLDMETELQLYSKEDLVSMLIAVGFSKIEIFGSLYKDKFSSASKHIIIKANK